MSIASERPIVIQDQTILPGQNKIAKLHIAKLPSNTKIELQVHVYRSTVPGPTALILGGLHGDEINGVEIIRSMIRKGNFEKLKKGSVIVIPLLNIYGFINFSRDVPDGKDVNRSFPGSKSGSLASRVAYTLTNEVLPYIDFGVDFHSGGATRYNYPQIRHTISDDEAKKMADAFAPPFIIENKPIPRSFRKTARDRGIPIIVFEGGESRRWDGLTIREGVRGIKRLLKEKGMLRFKVNPGKSVRFNKKSWLRAPKSGLFMWSVCSGVEVEKGMILGHIRDPYGQTEIAVKSRHNGYIIGHNNAAVVSQGDALFHIAYYEKSGSDK